MQSSTLKYLHNDAQLPIFFMSYVLENNMPASFSTIELLLNELIICCEPLRVGSNFVAINILLDGPDDFFNSQKFSTSNFY